MPTGPIGAEDKKPINNPFIMIYTINYILVEHPVCQQGKNYKVSFFIVKSPSQLHKDSIKILEYDTNGIKPSLRLSIFNLIGSSSAV